jgi:hypothetical protein
MGFINCLILLFIYLFIYLFICAQLLNFKWPGSTLHRNDLVDINHWLLKCQKQATEPAVGLKCRSISHQVKSSHLITETKMMCVRTVEVQV